MAEANRLRQSPSALAIADDSAEVRSAGQAVSRTAPTGKIAAATPIKNIGGRPRRYTVKLALEVCEHIADGLSLRSIEQLPGMPGKRTILAWALTDEGGFRALYDRARELQLEGEADEIVDIADDGRNDWLEREVASGRTAIVLNKEAVYRSKLRISTRQWRLARLMKGKYGDKLEQTHKTDDSFLDLWKSISAGAKKK